MASKNHVHTVLGIGNGRYICADPACSWRDAKAYLIRTESKCPYCGTKFVLSKTSLRLAKPWCGFCDKRPLTPEKAAKLKAQEMMLGRIDGTEE